MAFLWSRSAGSLRSYRSDEETSNAYRATSSAAADEQTAPSLSAAPVSVVAGSIGHHNRVRRSQDDYPLRHHGLCRWEPPPVGGLAPGWM